MAGVGEGGTYYFCTAKAFQPTVLASALRPWGMRGEEMRKMISVSTAYDLPDPFSQKSNVTIPVGKRGTTERKKDRALRKTLHHRRKGGKSESKGASGAPGLTPTHLNTAMERVTQTPLGGCHCTHTTRIAGKKSTTRYPTLHKEKGDSRSSKLRWKAEEGEGGGTSGAERRQKHTR
eukprot:RCo020376